MHRDADYSMRKIAFSFWLLAFGLTLMARADCPSVCPTVCYYVDSVGGSNGNAGTSPAAAWKNLYRVNEAHSGGSPPTTGYPSGAYICLLRGDTWYGRLVFYSAARGISSAGAALVADGTAGAPFTVDAYGSGAPPTINAEYPTTVAQWNLLGCASHICTLATGAGTGFPEGAPTRIDMVKFGGVWGTCKGANVLTYCPTTGGTAALTADYQFNYTNSSGILAVYDDLGSNPVTDYGGLAAVLDGSTQILDLDGVNYVAVQHLELLNQSWYGLEYRGNAGTDFLVACNLYSDTEVPFNFHGTGFYIHPGANSANLTFCNDEAHRGFYGFDLECPTANTPPCVTSASLVNVKAYFNRSFGLNDNTYTGTAAQYSYSHFYGNQIKWPLVGDVNGGVAGAGMISNMIDPAVAAWKLYVPRVALNFGDVGRQSGADTAFNGYESALGASPVSIGVATNFPVVPSLVTEIQGWVNSGYDISLLGLSDTSYQNPNVLTVSCPSATAATLSIGGSPLTLSTSVTGGSCSAVSYDLTSSSYLTLQQVEFALRAAGYSATLPQPCSACSWITASAMKSVDLAALSGQSILSPYTLAVNPVTFLNSELSGAQAWVTANLTGTSGKYVYWYPGTLFCNVAPCTPLSGVPETYTVSNGYDLARGAISMQAGADGIQGGYDLVASAGIDAHGLVTCQMGGWAALSPLQLAQTLQVLAEKSAVWGVPFLCYFQPGTFSNVQLARVVSDLGASGITLLTNSAVATLLEAKTNIPAGSTSYAWAPDGAAAAYNGSETYLSPTVGTGSTLGAAYEYDVWGRLQAQFRGGWDIGATVLVPVFLGLKPGH
jgi:hypothetical protein